jgi:uncharacterized membrane protein YbhN (UPF0104 family)
MLDSSTPTARQRRTAHLSRVRLTHHVVEAALATLVVTAVLVHGVPLVSGVDWSEVGPVLEGVSPADFAVLATVWLAGLWVHTIALAAAMPGLSRSRAFYLNLTGSAVSNVVPLGGAAGTALNYWSCRSWGFSRGAFIQWALITNFWDNAIKLLLPAVAISLIALTGGDLTAITAQLALVGLALFAVYLTLGWLLLNGRWGERALSAAVVRVVRGLRPDQGSRGDRLTDFRIELAALVRSSTRAMAVGKLAYAVLQAGLLWLCLDVVGEVPTVAVVTTAFAVERLMSVAVLTPGGAGFVEVGTVGALVALGTEPTAAVTAVVLYRAFVFGLEIPLGTALLLGRAVLHPRARALPEAAPTSTSAPASTGPTSTAPASAEALDGPPVGQPEPSGGSTDPRAAQGIRC